METLRPLVLLFVFILMLTESLTQEQQQVLLMQDVPDNRDVIRDRRSPQFEGLFGYGGGRRGHHGYAGSHIKKQTTTYGIGPFYASYSTSHANSQAGHAHGPHYGHGYNDHYGYRPGYKPYHHNGYHGYQQGYHGNHGHHGGGGGGGLFTSFLDF